jgi:hypothetical protein
LDVHEIAARFLSAALSGISATRISELESGLRTDEFRWILSLLLSKKLLATGDSSVYWTTEEGVKFLDIRFNLERMLKAQTSLV